MKAKIEARQELSLKIFMLTFLLTFLAGCLESGSSDLSSSKSKSESSTPANDPIILSGDLVVREGVQIAFDPLFKFQSDVSSGYAFEATNLPSFLAINSTSGEITGSSKNSSGLYENIIIKATRIINPTEVINSSPITIAVNGDPLRQYAWHLDNTGQSAFSVSGGVSGIDINVDDVYLDDVTGDGVRVAVSDSGVTYNHDDLHLNQLSGQHRDYSLNSPYTGEPVASNFHGTAVTGIIAAMGWNNYGSIGVAPEAKFAGFQFLDSPQNTSILIHQASGDFDVFNYSYGDEIYEDTISDSSYISQLRFMTINQDSVFVKAAGNEFISLDQDTGICASHNANAPFENESPFLLVVGSVNADGGKASYSNAGSNIWISAPGGEDGEGFGPGIISTDLPTCFKGISKVGSGSSNDFEYGHSKNLKCDYTALMNGTSAATPMVSGVVALMKSANSNLKMRDIKHILAATAVKVDPSHSHITNWYGKDHPSKGRSGAGCTEDLSLSNHEYELGWVTNSAGYHFNNFYGFGMVDASAAVAAAKTYVSNLGALVETNPNFNSLSYRSVPANGLIQDNTASGLTDTLNITAALTVESIQIKVQVSHARSGEIGIKLTSPDGTKSILMNINNSFLFDEDSNLNMVFTSHAFYGEDSAGDWTIKVIDGRSGNTGALTKWEMNILGH